MSRFLIFCASTLLTLAISAQSFEDQQIIISEDTPAMTTNGTNQSDNIIIRNEPAQKMLSQLPENSLAAQIADQKHTISWRPQWHGGIQGVRLGGFALSKDSSVLALIETVGEISGPFSSRIIFLSTIDWSVLRILEFDRVHFKQLCFLEKCHEVLAATMLHQPVLEQKDDRMMLIDLHNGEIINDVRIPGNGNAAMLATGKFLVMKSDRSPDLNIYEINGKDTFIPREKINLGSGAVLMSANNDGKSIVATGNGKLNTIDLNTAEITDTMDLPDGCEIINLTVAGSTTRTAMAATDGRTYLYDDKNRSELGNKGGGGMVYYKRNDTVLIMNRGGYNLIPWDLKTLTPGKEIRPGNIRPKTMGHVAYFTVLAGDRILLCSSFGDIFELNRIKGSWKKKIAISALR